MKDWAEAIIAAASIAAFVIFGTYMIAWGGTWQMKWLIMLFLLFMPIVSSQERKTEYRCVRWAWTGDVYNRKVVCLKWEKVERK